MSDDDLCDCGAADCELALAVLAEAIDKLPDTVTLFYLSQGDRLTDDQVREIFQGQYDKVSEHIQEWFREEDHYAIGYEIEQILGEDDIETLEAHPSQLMPDHWTLKDDLSEAIRERDDSDPMGELTGATPDVMLRLDARVVIEDGDPPEAIIEVLHRELGLSSSNRDRIAAWLAENHNEVWGDVEIIWRADVADAVEQFKPWEDISNGNVAVFTDPWIDVAGVLLQLSGEISIPLTKVNDLPSVDSDIYCDQRYECSPKVMSEFDRYREGLVEFMEYKMQLQLQGQKES